MTSYELRPIGRVESPLIERQRAPKQGFEGAPDAWLVFAAGVADALRDLTVGDEIWGLRVCVSDLEALDGTPILDTKPVLAGGR
jgi:tRNA (Thr-GGU) A37 N-methylase